MADNTRLNAGTDGDLYRSIDRSGSGPKVQVIAIDLTPGSGSETLMAGAMPVSGTFWQATQPVSLAAAIAATQSGTWSVRSQDGSGNALTSALRGSERALSIQVVDASGNQVTSFGGGGGGDTSLLALEAGGHLAAIDGKVPGLGQALAAASVPVVLTASQLSALTPLSTVAATGTFWQATQPVSGTFWQATQPISGTVTANAGTNLNTSALALETGGHLATIDGKVPSLGQALAAGSVPVVLTAAQLTTLTPLTTVAVTGTFWQATQPVSLASNVTVVGTGTFAVQAAQSGTWNVGTVTTITNVVHVDDNSGSLTVDNAGTFAVQATQAGTWNVGTVTTVTTVASVTAITNALPAGTNLLGQVSASAETGTLYNGTTALTPKFAAISASSSGQNLVVAAVTSKKIRVLRWSLSANAAVNVKWQSDTGSPVDLTGLFYMTQYQLVGAGYSPVGHFETASGKALYLNLSGAIATGGGLAYVEV